MLVIDVLLGCCIVLTIGIVLTFTWGLLYGVPFVPTPAHISKAMVELLPLHGTETVIDLGAGDGRVLEYVRKRYPNVIARGYEIVPTVWLLGFFRSKITRSGVQMIRQDMFKADVSDADVVIVYLFPDHVRALQKKLFVEMKPHSIIITHTFGIPDIEPFIDQEVARLGGTVHIRAYRVPARSSIHKK